MTISCCMCELVETAQSRVDDPRAEVTGLIGYQSTGQALVCRSFTIGGLLAWPSGRESNTDSGRSERQTRLLAHRQAQETYWISRL